MTIPTNSDRPAVTLTLGRDGMGDNASEADFDAWTSYVCEHIDEESGCDVTVEIRGARDVQADDIRGGDGRMPGCAPGYDGDAAVGDAMTRLWEAFCSDASAWPARGRCPMSETVTQMRAKLATELRARAARKYPIPLTDPPPDNEFGKAMYDFATDLVAAAEIIERGAQSVLEEVATEALQQATKIVGAMAVATEGEGQEREAKMVSGEARMNTLDALRFAAETETDITLTTSQAASVLAVLRAAMDTAISGSRHRELREAVALFAQSDVSSTCVEGAAASDDASRGDS